jgi:hypothetical protein
MTKMSTTIMQQRSVNAEVARSARRIKKLYKSCKTGTTFTILVGQTTTRNTSIAKRKSAKSGSGKIFCTDTASDEEALASRRRRIVIDL